MGIARMERIGEQMKQEIGRILLEELQDPRIGFVTITKVEVTRDLRQAKVYFSYLGPKNKLRNTQVGLERSAGFIRKLLAQRVKIRYTPELMFKLDQGSEYSIHISEVLEKIKEKDNEQSKDNSSDQKIF
ncbi:MAG: 30S ribosome-binding factor RbfA [Candidatus Omnitrophica bacterium]|nr:30S ribosome-binding factor RbfA [Candidatus Omnitrophota bacterium]